MSVFGFGVTSQFGVGEPHTLETIHVVLFCGSFCLSVPVLWILVLSLDGYWKDHVLPSHRGSGGVGKTERLSGWSLCV